MSPSSRETASIKGWQRSCPAQTPLSANTPRVRHGLSAVASICAAAWPLAPVPVTNRAVMETDLFPLHDSSYNLLNFLLFRPPSPKLD